MVDAVDPEHRRRVEHVAGAVASFERHARPGCEIAITGCVDEYLAAYREAPGLGLHEHGVDPVRACQRAADSVGVKQNLDAGCGE